MQKAICFLLIGLLLLPISACNFMAVPTNEETTRGEIAISGAFALYPLVTRWAEAYSGLTPECVSTSPAAAQARV